MFSQTNLSILSTLLSNKTTIYNVSKNIKITSMRSILFIIVCLTISLHTNGQMRLRIVTYNVENLFDTRRDSLHEDKDFTPQGIKHWGDTRYKLKLAPNSRCQPHYRKCALYRIA